MDDTTWEPVRQLLVRTATDEELRARVLADPRAAIREEAGIDLPEDWRLIGRVSATGTVELTFADDELPLDYLAVVGAGYSTSYSFPPSVAATGAMGNPINTLLRPT